MSIKDSPKFKYVIFIIIVIFTIGLKIIYTIYKDNPSKLAFIKEQFINKIEGEIYTEENSNVIINKESNPENKALIEFKDKVDNLMKMDLSNFPESEKREIGIKLDEIESIATNGNIKEGEKELEKLRKEIIDKGTIYDKEKEERLKKEGE